MKPATATSPKSDLPATLGPYHVLEVIGAGLGGMGEIFLCYDPSLDRKVVVKRVPAGASEEILNRFHREASLLSGVAHPGYAHVYRYWMVEGRPAMAMEFIDGLTLRELMDLRRTLPLDVALCIGWSVAEALRHAHLHGIIHRDVKPANILALTNSAGDVTDVKLTDFGSVLNMTAESTQVHQVGSLAYMAPEQLDGQVLDCRADIYSLGAVLYHLVAGKPPFDATSQAVLMNQIYNQAPASLAGMRAGVNGAVDEVIQKALAKRPDDRYPNWDAFAQALSGLIAEHKVPRGHLQGVLDSERFNLLRSLDFFSSFGDVALWEVVHRAKWQRFSFGHALYRRGEEGRTFHIIAQGSVEVYRNGKRVALLGAGTSVGEMAYLAPSPELRRHSTDVVVTEPATTISFTPEAMQQLSPNCRHLFDEAFIRVLVRRLHAAHEALAHPRRIM